MSGRRYHASRRMVPNVPPEETVSEPALLSTDSGRSVVQWDKQQQLQPLLGNQRQEMQNHEASSSSSALCEVSFGEQQKQYGQQREEQVKEHATRIKYVQDAERSRRHQTQDFTPQHMPMQANQEQTIPGAAIEFVRTVANKCSPFCKLMTKVVVLTVVAVQFMLSFMGYSTQNDTICLAVAVSMFVAFFMLIMFQIVYTSKYLRRCSRWERYGQRQIFVETPAFLLGTVSIVLIILEIQTIHNDGIHDNATVSLSNTSTMISNTSTTIWLPTSVLFEDIACVLIQLVQVVFSLIFIFSNSEQKIVEILQSTKSKFKLFANGMFITVCYCNMLLCVFAIAKAMHRGQSKLGMISLAITTTAALYFIFLFGKLLTDTYGNPRYVTVNISGWIMIRILITIGCVVLTLTLTIFTGSNSEVLTITVLSGRIILHVISICSCAIALHDIDVKKPGRYKFNEKYLFVACLFACLNTALQVILLLWHDENNVIFHLTWAVLLVHFMHSVLQYWLITHITNKHDASVTDNDARFKTVVLLLFVADAGIFVINLYQLLFKRFTEEVLEIYSEPFWCTLFNCVASGGIFYYLLSFILLYEHWFQFVYEIESI